MKWVLVPVALAGLRGRTPPNDVEDDIRLEDRFRPNIEKGFTSSADYRATPLNDAWRMSANKTTAGISTSTGTSPSDPNEPVVRISWQNFIKLSSNFSKLFMNFCIQFSIFQHFFKI